MYPSIIYYNDESGIVTSHSRPDSEPYIMAKDFDSKVQDAVKDSLHTNANAMGETLAGFAKAGMITTAGSVINGRAIDVMIVITICFGAVVWIDEFSLPLFMAYLGGMILVRIICGWNKYCAIHNIEGTPDSEVLKHLSGYLEKHRNQGVATD